MYIYMKLCEAKLIKFEKMRINRISNELSLKN